MKIKLELEIKKSPVMSVTIDKVSYDDNDVEIDRNRIVIINSLEGRKTLQANYSQEIVDEVFAVWGDPPTEEDFVLPDLSTVKPQPTAEQLAILDLIE